MYASLFVTPHQHYIIYSDPIISSPKPEVVQTIQMPALSPQEPLQTTLHALSSGISNLYAWGNCTAFVASRLPVPQTWGNAINWGYAAMAAGYTVTPVPQVGAIAWNIDDSYLGHVAVVIAVNGGVPTIQEMNYNGLGVIDERIPNAGEFQYILF